MKKIQILAMATLVSPVVLAAAPTASAEPTWWGVINNHAEFRVAHDSGKTTAYEIEVKRAGDANFSLLTNAVKTLTGTGGTIFNVPFDGSEPAAFRCRRVNGDGAGSWSPELEFSETDGLAGTIVSSGQYNSTYATAKACDGDYSTVFSSKQVTDTPLWIGYDFGGPRRVRAIRFIIRNGRGAALTNATVEVATQEDFSDAVVVDTFPETAYTSVEILERSFTPTVGRYARLRKAEPLDGQVLTIAELEFLGEDATPLPEVADLAVTTDRLSGECPTIGWTDATAGKAGAKIYRATAAGGPWTEMAELVAGTTSWTDTSAAMGIRYYYAVAFAKGETLGPQSEPVPYRRIHRLERTDEDNTKLREGVTMLLTTSANEGNATWKSANIFDGNTDTTGSQNVEDARLGLDFGESTPVGVEVVRAMNSKDRTLRLQKARVYGKNDTTMDGGAQLSVGGLPFGHRVWTSVECDDPKCYRTIYLMRPDHVNFYGCMCELELYGWTAAEEAAVLLAPTRLRHSVSAAGVALEWDSCNRAASYRVEKLVAGEWTVLGTVTATTFTDAAAATDSTRASYRVVSVAADDEEAISRSFEFVPYLPGNGDGLTAIFTSEFTNAVWSAGEEQVAVTNVGAALDYDWEYTPLSPTWNQGGNSSVSRECIYNRGRWWGKLVVPFAGTYTLSTPSGTPCLYGVAVDGKWVINGDGDGNVISGTVTLTAGEHDFYAEFAKNLSRNSKFELSWRGPVTEEVIPASQFRATPPYDFGEWTIERTMDLLANDAFLPSVAKAFPAGDGAIRINRGRAGYSTSLNRYHLLARPVEKDFSFTCHVKCVFPTTRASSRFALLVADSMDPKGPMVVGDLAWATSSGGPGATRGASRQVAGADLDLPSAYTLRGDALLSSGEADLKVKRVLGTVEFFYLDENTGAWVSFAKFENTASYIGRKAVLGFALYDALNASQDVVWEVSDMAMEVVRSGTLFLLK